MTSPRSSGGPLIPQKNTTIGFKAETLFVVHGISGNPSTGKEGTDCLVEFPRPNVIEAKAVNDGYPSNWRVSVRIGRLASDCSRDWKYSLDSLGRRNLDLRPKLDYRRGNARRKCSSNVSLDPYQGNSRNRNNPECYHNRSHYSRHGTNITPA